MFVRRAVFRMPKRFSMTPLALAVLVAVSALQLGPLQAQGAPVTTTVLAKGTIINGRFVRSFSLDGSALTVAPYAGVATPLSPARRAALWATAPLSGMVQGLGLGVVTVSPTRTKQSGTPRVTSLVRVLAWVGLVKGSEISYGCPAMRASRHYSTVVPPANGWQAVIVPLNPQKSIAVFRPVVISAGSFTDPQSRRATSNCPRRGSSSAATSFYLSRSVDPWSDSIAAVMSTRA